MEKSTSGGAGHGSPVPMFVPLRASDVVTNLSQSEDEVTSIIENTYTGERQIIRSSCVIACDGTKSRVRQAAGIELDEEDGR
jgi:2-polyprenyl-6-methoxyphenol hydroxylase-like FAD-dependent oxidoreductase